MKGKEQQGMKLTKEQSKKIGIGILEFIVVCMIFAVVEWVMFGFMNLVELRQPITYAGGDGFAGYATAKSYVMGDEWRLGWPAHEDTGAYVAILNVPYRILVAFLCLFTRDSILIQNIYFFVIPLLNALVSYYIFRSMKIRRYLALPGAALFGMSPFVQGRIFGHFALASVECIPLVFMVCFWLCEDDQFAVVQKGYFRHRRNVIMVLLAWLFANNGMVYYPFFSCFILLLVGVYNLIRTKDGKRLLASLVVIAQIVFWLAIGFVPPLIGMLMGAGNAVTNGVYRDATRATKFGLEMTSMFLSPKGYGIPGLFEKYACLFDRPYPMEQYKAYLGIVAIIGFVILLYFVLDNREYREIEYRRMKVLALVTLALLLLAVPQGIGVIVAVFIPYISCYNRVNPYISYACIAAFVMLGEKLLQKPRKRKVTQILIAAGLVGVMLYAFYEQSGCYNHITRAYAERIQKEYMQDKQFFDRVEASAGEGGAVFVLPYMKRFETGGLNGINDYENYRGYIVNDSLKWSYGSSVGSISDQWCALVSELSPEEMIPELRKAGFAGIYLDLAGYEETDWETLINALLGAAGAEDIICHENERLLYLPLN